MHPILFEFKIGNLPIAIRYYGLMYVVAIVVAIFLTRYEAKRKQMNLTLDDILDFVLWAVPAGIIGARLYYVLFQWDSFSDDWLEIFKIWHGGLAIHGGLIGGAIAVLLVSKWKRASFWQVADAMAPSLVLGQALGRFGNFMNGDAYGTPTDLPWGLRFPIASPAGSAYPDRDIPGWSEPLHPAMLYELIGNLMIFGLLWWLRKKNFKDGFLVSLYLILYSLLRFFVEIFRGDSLMLGPFRAAQVISVLIIAAFGWLMLQLRLYERPQPGA